MAKMVFDCDYCDKTFSTLGEAESHEAEHYKRCANPACEERVFIKDPDKEGRKKFCSRKCGNVVKVQNFRARKNLEDILS